MKRPTRGELEGARVGASNSFLRNEPKCLPSGHPSTLRQAIALATVLSVTLNAAAMRERLSPRRCRCAAFSAIRW